MDKHYKITNTVFDTIKTLFGKDGQHNPGIVDYVADGHTVIRSDKMEPNDWYKLARHLAEHIVDLQEQLQEGNKTVAESVALARAIIDECYFTRITRKKLIRKEGRS